MSPFEAPQQVGAQDSDFLQLITPQGERVPCPELDDHVADIDARALAGLYIDMVAIRRLDAEGTALQRQGELGLWAPLLGQEAAQIGAGRALDAADYVFPSYREHGIGYCRGVRPGDMLRMWRGAAPSGWDPNEFNLANQQIVIGAQTLHAAGYAMGLKLDGASNAAITFFGDGATSQGDVSEAMVFATSFAAPLVFFCQNNHWAISVPVGVQANAPLAGRAAGFGMPAVRVDGNDVLAVLAATRAALEGARNGQGPSFIEAITYRMGAHTTADDPTRYRDELELEAWRARDPIDRVAALLRNMGADLEAITARAAVVADEVAAGLRAAIAQMPDPEPDELFAHVYAEANPQLERQQRQYAWYLEQFAATHTQEAGA